MGYKPKKELHLKYSDKKSAIMRPIHVALHFGISVNTVWRWIKLGILPKPTRIGSRFTFWQREQIENLNLD